MPCAPKGHWATSERRLPGGLACNRNAFFMATKKIEKEAFPDRVGDAQVRSSCAPPSALSSELGVRGANRAGGPAPCSSGALSMSPRSPGVRAANPRFDSARSRQAALSPARRPPPPHALQS